MGNRVADNLIYDAPHNALIDRFKEMNADQPPYSVRYTELATLFADEPGAPKGDFRVKADSPAYQMGFRRIPIDRIGLYDDEFHADLHRQGRP